MSMAAAAAAPAAQAAPPPWIRGAVRDVLENAPHYQALAPQDRRALAQAMVKVSTLAAELISEETQAQDEVDRQRAGAPAPARAQGMPLAHAQEQPGFGESANRIASTTRNVLNAVSFPRFVTDLINGVFRAMLDSNSQQMQQYVELLGAVSASAEGFERTQFGLSQVRQWVADHFPEAIEYDTPDPGENPDPEDVANIRLRLRGGASMPGAEEIRTTLAMEPDESVDASNPEQLVPLARRYLARQRQQMLATMVSMGMQRIVVDSGRITAGMRFHIDTRSAASEDAGTQFGLQNRVRASGSFGVGPWGASAEVENNISYVSTQRNQNSEEINTDLELNSTVELNFRSDYLPLNQMAAQAQADRIRNATLNPSADIPDPSAARNTRLQAQIGAERERRTGLNTAIDAASRPPAPAGAMLPNPRMPGTGASGGGGSGGAASGAGASGGAASGGGASGGAASGGGASRGVASGGGGSGGAASGGGAAASGGASGGAASGGGASGGAASGGGASGGAASGGAASGAARR